MNNIEKVSVIVPVYKVEQYLERCINSLLNQTYENITILLVDDGSPDNCPQICDMYAKKYHNILALHKSNGGLGSARNYGVEHACSKWVAFVDSDDYVEPNYIKDMMEIRNQFNVNLVITRVLREKEDGSGKTKVKDFAPCVINSRNAIFMIYSGIDLSWAAVGKLFNRELLIEYPFPDGYYEDCACMYNIISSEKIIAIGNFSDNYHYIWREGSILASQLNEKHFRIFDIATEFNRFVTIEFPDNNLLVPLFYKKIIVQQLNMQNMAWKDYRYIYLKYRYLFRGNVFKLLFQRDISIKFKIYYLSLCMTPGAYFIFQKILRIKDRLARD